LLDVPPAPTAAGVLTQWRLGVVPLLVVVALLSAYGFGVRSARRRGHHWPTWRTVLFAGLGVGSYAVTTLGFLGVYSPYLRWAFAAQAALLLLVVPALVALGRPVELARKALGDNGSARLDRVLRSRPLRVLSHPVGGPALLLALLLLFLTPLPPEVRSHAAALAAAQVLLPLLGLMAVLPVASGEEPASTTTMAIGFLIAFVELIADALPGILLRLHSTVIGGAASLSSLPTWRPSPLRDQQLSGDVLWFLGEAIDLPFLAWLVIRWIRADQREAAVVDARLDSAPYDGRPWWVAEADAQEAPHRPRRDED
jgi:cytochrome c oxidase assembly factor CtaG